MSGQKILDGLKDAVAGNLSRVHIEGQTWARIDPWPESVGLTRPEYDALMGAEKALSVLHAYLDFDEPLSDNKPCVFEDYSGINKAFADAYEAIAALRASGILEEGEKG